MSSLYTKQGAMHPDRRGFAVLTLKYKLQKTWNEYMITQWDRGVLIFSIISAGVYVVETYQDTSTTPMWSKVVEVLVASFFTLDYAIRWYLAESRCKFTLYFASILDLLCILPVIFIFVLEEGGKAQQFIFFLQFLRVVRLIRILRGYRAVSVSKRGDPDNLKKQMNILIYTLMTLIFITAALLHLVEKYAKVPWMDNEEGNAELQSFHDAVYFVVITLTTVGYGDITPKTVVGKALVMIFVTASVIIIPRETGKLSELMAVTSQYAGTFTQEDAAHVVVCGHVDFLNLRSFLMEFFHEAHGSHRMVVLVMSPSPPSKTVKLLFGANGLYGNRVQYFEGSALDEYDLTRLKYGTACAAFFLTDKLSTDPHLSDCETIMRVLSAKNHSPNVPVLVQILLPESKEQGIAAGADYIVCLRELKMHILARSGMVPGFSTLFCNLFRNEDFVFGEPGHWLSEYCHGISYEIYTLTFPSAFIDKPFSDVAYFIFKEWATLLFGVQRADDTGGVTLLLNPIGEVPYFLSRNDRGFLFATDASVPDKIQAYEGDLLTTTPKYCDYAEGTGRENFHDVVTRPEAADERCRPHSRRRSHRRSMTAMINISIDDGGSTAEKTRDNVKSVPHLPKLVPLIPTESDWKRWGHERVFDTVPTDMTDHIIIVLHNTANVLHFVAPLRVDVKSPSVPIVAMVPSMPSGDILRAASKYRDVYFFIGCGKERSDFIRCGVSRCRATLILFSGTIGDTRIRYPSDYDVGEDMMADYDAISTMTCLGQCIKEMQNPPFTLVELVHKQNTRFFPPKHDDALGKITEVNDYIVPSYAAGRVYSDTVMDSLLCQVFYNSDLLRVLKLFLLPPHSVVVPESGVFTSSAFYTMHVWDCLVGSTFGTVLKTLLLGNDKMLPVGLLRSPDRLRQGIVSPGPGGAAPYVFLCAPLETIIRRDDMIYVLADKEPRNPVKCKIKRNQSTPSFL